MCGIVGYTGREDAVPLIMNGLHKLEYRGYDSAGIAVVNDGGIEVRKAKGELEHLDALLLESPVSGHTGIGHTRWATHGEPSYINAHPQTSFDGKIAIVHNGIVENYLKIKKHLREQGIESVSETDTEIAANLLASLYKGNMLETLYEALPMLEGSYSFAIVSVDEPGVLYCARKESPLVIGKCSHGSIIASDIPAMLEHTRDVFFLNNMEIARLTEDSIEFFDSTLRVPIEKESQHIEWDAESAEKGGFEHFMIKEIHEEPTVLRNTLTRYVDVENYAVRENAIPVTVEEARSIKKIGIVACGTAYHAGLVGKYLFEKLLRVPTEVTVASEFIYQDPIIDPSDFYIIVSQSGETRDSIAAMHLIQKMGAKVTALCNVVGSTISRDADHVIYTLAGPEMAVASTKAFATQLMLFYIFAFDLAKKRNCIEEELFRHYIDELAAVPDKAQIALDDKTMVQQFASQVFAGKNAFFLGRGVDNYLAMEGALKLKEISYVHAEPYAAGELKHGPIALIEDGVLVIALATQDHLVDKMASNIKEVNVRHGNILSLTNGENPIVEAESSTVWRMPKADSLVMPMITIVPLQLFAYYVSVLRGCNVDKPRNLAKSVTVE